MHVSSHFKRAIKIKVLVFWVVMPPWQQGSSKVWYPTTSQNGVTTQKTATWKQSLV